MWIPGKRRMKSQAKKKQQCLHARRGGTGGGTPSTSPFLYSTAISVGLRQSLSCQRLLLHAINRWTVLSSEIETENEGLPPSDPPDPSSSDSESEHSMAMPKMPALTTVLGISSASHANLGPPKQRRGSSVPPQDSPDDERLILRQRAEQQRQKTRLSKREQKLEKEKRRLRRNQLFDKFLEDMKADDISLAEFLDHVFNPETRLKSDWRWRGFFAHQSVVERIFGYWTTSKYNQSTRNFLHNWATSQVSKAALGESRAINESFFVDFSLTNLVHTIRGMAPTVFKILDSFSTTTRQLKSATEKFLKKKELMKGAAALTLLRGASQNNNYVQAVNGMYLAATGAQRQHFPVLGVYGFSIGYTSIISSVLGTGNGREAAGEKTVRESLCVMTKLSSLQDAADDMNEVDEAPGVPVAQKKKRKKRTKKDKRKRVRGPGLLSVLRDACMATARSLAKSNLSLLTYDNINLMNRIAEQILGRKSAQENGTCATLIALHNAKLEHMLTTSLDASILNARPLTLEDIILNEDETKFLTKNMVHTILRIIVLHGGEGFQKWREDLDKSQPVSEDVIEVHKTPLHPLPTMEIDESSITGNVEVVEEIMRVLGKTDDPDYGKYVQIIAGDQLTIARQRSILNVRLGHESGPHAWRHIVLMPGLFHAKIADCHGVLETHFGKPSAGARSPGSLGFHNTVLDRLPITLTSLPPFRTCRDLIMVSLYARVLHCLLIVSGHDSLEACAASIDTWDRLVSHAEKIYETYTDVDRVQELRERRIPEERARDIAAKAAVKGKKKPAETAKEHPPHIRKGDMVFENAVLFLRDALLTREFADAIKSGDSGRIVIILRLWAFSYRGNGRTKYAHEMLHILHNLICVWTNELRYIGKIKAFVEIDLVQEHLNFWIKKIYKADGAGHSWDWLALVSPCVDILRQLATRMNVELGTRQGSKHATPDLAADIAALMASLDEHEVYVEKEGRVLDDDEKPAPDVISVGMAALTHGTTTTPLAEFNQQFEVLRERRRLTPVADLLSLINAREDLLPQTSADESDAFENASAESDEEFPRPADLLGQGGDETEEESETEDDALIDSPTLTRFDEGDVELDIDGVPEWYLDDEDSEDGDSGTDDEDSEDDEE
ncbi:hypothetical protein R3P38DRAFT_3333003 [Favolaschia claudopus]|uniref:DUF6589 domain-containing protein n=1 Tax=Favolaschia claudopus TaxID=2862362 RepID=A0AAV9ZIB4_9AGAR